MRLAAAVGRDPWGQALALGTCLVLAVGMWAATAAYLAQLESATVEQARATRSNLASSLGQAEEASVRAIDLSLVFLRLAWRRDPASFGIAVGACEDLLRREGVVQVAVLGRDGGVSYSRLPQAGALNFSDRDYFAFHRSSPEDRLHASAPVFGRITQRWAIQFSRALRDEQGRFEGVVVMAVPPPALESAYQAIDLGPQGVVTLIRDDGQILARSADLATAAGLRMENWPAIATGTATAGDFKGMGGVDGSERLFSYRRLQYGLSVLVGQSVPTVRAPYVQQRNYVLAVVITATIFLLAVAATMSMRLRDKERFARRQEDLMLELHDGCIQAIYAIGLRLQSARGLAGTDPDAVPRVLSEAEADLNLVIQEIRAFIGGAALPRRTAEEFIEQMQRSIPATHRPMFELDIDPDVATALTPEKAEHVLRIAREAASNVARHAGARSARVSLSRNDSSLLLSIQDDGRGEAEVARTESGLGLAHIHARARKLGGTASVVSPPGKGTVVRVEFPA